MDNLDNSDNQQYKWVVCRSGYGYPVHDGQKDLSNQTFREDTVGLVVKAVDGEWMRVRFIHTGQEWDIDPSEVGEIDILVERRRECEPERVCNSCLRLLPKEEFSRNQTNKHGIVRRPSCKECRKPVDKRRKHRTKAIEAQRPIMGAPWKCPVCQHAYIVGVTCKVSADHDHDTGKFREFVCDTCNTGMGKFKNGQDATGSLTKYLKKHGAKR